MNMSFQEQKLVVQFKSYVVFFVNVKDVTAYDWVRLLISKKSAHPSNN